MFSSVVKTSTAKMSDHRPRSATVQNFLVLPPEKRHSMHTKAPQYSGSVSALIPYYGITAMTPRFPFQSNLIFLTCLDFPMEIYFHTRKTAQKPLYVLHQSWNCFGENWN